MFTSQWFLLLLSLQTSFFIEEDLDTNCKESSLLSFADQRLSVYQNCLLDTNLFLMPLFKEHSPYLYTTYTNKKSMQYYGFGQTKTIEEVNQIVARKASLNLCNKDFFYFLIVTKSGIAGQVCLIKKENVYEIAYDICPAFTNRGIATRASQIAIDFIKSPIEASVHPYNLSSIAVLKKIGFVLDKSRVNIPKFNAIRDYYILQQQDLD